MVFETDLPNADFHTLLSEYYISAEVKQQDNRAPKHKKQVIKMAVSMRTAGALCPSG